MVNPNAEAALGSGVAADANNPCMSSLVNVRYVPPAFGVKEKWEVWPDMTESICSPATLQAPFHVGGLLDSRRSWSSVGQFSLPFFITIERKPMTVN